MYRSYDAMRDGCDNDDDDDEYRKKTFTTT